MKPPYKMLGAWLLVIVGIMMTAITYANAPKDIDNDILEHQRFDTFTDVEAKKQVDTSSVALVNKVAPGELLPVSVKLANFGGGNRVDVLVNYGIFSRSGEEIYSTSETVAVETTANFVKTLQVPFNITPGTYNAQTYITYEGQLVPATGRFPFTVERKIWGMFQSDLYRYVAVIFLISVFVFIFARTFVRYRRPTRYMPVDYSNIPRETRVFYELISDTVANMRQRVGDAALDIAGGIKGLGIDKETGRILKLTESPSKVVAELVSKYEKELGKKVSFFFRQKKTTE